VGQFVCIAVDHRRLDGARSKAIVRACPVDIFTYEPCGVLSADASREDECILCARCVTVAPDAISVTRAYGANRPVLPTDSDQ
jgi:NAD-dependent dihydropyrimidine dehydrogenase PreA subunit